MSTARHESADFAALMHRAERSRLAELSAVDGVRTRIGGGWTAIRTGLDSNDLNGVVSDPGHVPDAGLLAELGEWFAGAPAVWHLATPDPGFPGRAAEAGWHPEASARCAGRRLPMTVPVPSGLVVRQVADAA